MAIVVTITLYFHQSFCDDEMTHSSLDFNQALYRQLNMTQSRVQDPVCSTTKADFKHFNR